MLESVQLLEVSIAAGALVVLAIAAWVEASLGTARELTIRELLSDRLSKTTDSDVDETTQIRSAMVLIEMISAGLATALIAHAALDINVEGAFAIGLIIATVLHILMGRVLPGFFATNPEDVWRSWPARFGRVLRLLFFPIVWPIERLQRYPTRTHARRDDGGDQDFSSPMAREIDADGNGSASDDLHDEEHDMISGVLQLVDAKADDIMVPRLDLVAVPSTATVAETVDVAISAGHSRIPVYGDSIDEIVGIVYAKDLLRFVTEEGVDQSIEDEIRPAYFVPESKRVDELLQELQSSKVHLAIVVDEYGGTAGVVTIEDILEEIVGEIEDEYDRELPRIEKLDDGAIVVDGRLLVEDVLGELDLYWEERAQGTIAGLIQRELGRIPKPGDTVETEGLRLEVETVERRRVRRVKCYRIPLDETGIENVDAASQVQDSV
ncbi:MAG: hemolysin family protein [Thermomicrobiales bacterium]